MQSQQQRQLDYFVIGHVTEDYIDGTKRLGGSGLYCSLLASRMGLSTALYTSCNLELPDEVTGNVMVEIQSSDQTTTFNNQYSTAGRKQLLLERAPDLDLSKIPDHFINARVIHLAPVAGEIKLDALPEFPQAELFLSLQGWLRKWDQDGLISPAPWPGINQVPGNLAGGFVSVEDLGQDQTKLEHILEIFPVLVLTQGSSGAVLYQNGKPTHIPVQSKKSGDPTGAGDIFAAAYIIFNTIGGKTPPEAAHLASILAGLSIERIGLAGVPTKEELEEFSIVM